MKTLLILLSLLSPKPDCLELDIMLIGDFSTSTDGHQVNTAEAFQAFANRFQLSETGVKMGLIVFGSDCEIVTPLTSSSVELSHGIEILKSHEAMGSTNMNSALQLATVELMKGRQVQKVIILISDGLPDNQEGTLKTANDLKTILGYTICTVLVTASSTDEVLLTKVASVGGYVRTDYEGLASVIESLNICL